MNTKEQLWKTEDMELVFDLWKRNVKPTLVSTWEKRTIGTINYVKQAGEDDLEEIPGNKISSW